MFNTKTLAASFLTLAACGTEPAVELAPQQAEQALASAASMGIIVNDAPMNWVVMTIAPQGDLSGVFTPGKEPGGDDTTTPDEADEGPVTPEPGIELPESSPEGSDDGELEPGVPAIFEGVYETFITGVAEQAFGIEKGPSENFEVIREDEGYRINGFVTVHRGGDAETINHFYGQGTTIFVEPETGCEIEWSRNIEGVLGEEGAAEADVRDHALYLDIDCAPEGMEDGVAFAAYHIELSKIGMGPQ